MRSLLALVLLVLIASSPDVFAADLSSEDIKLYQRAFAAAEEDRWTEAHRLAGRTSNGLLAEVLQWRDFRRADTLASFAAIAAFVDDHPDWPELNLLRGQAERIVPAGAQPEALVAWFGRHPPLVGDGALALVRAARRIDPEIDVGEVVRLAWTTMDFTSRAERTFYSAYRRHLTAADNEARLDRLLWQGKQTAAKRMLRRVNKDQAALGVARLALQRREPGVDGAVARVPRALRDDPGLLFDRMRWRRQKRLDTAREIALNPPPDDFDSGQWGRESATLARRALAAGHYTEAYRLVTSVALTEGAVFAELEFLAGWISMVFLDGPDAALDHFAALYEGTRFPVSRARGAYWAGRAAAAKGDDVLAITWFIRAARHDTTFYGQQAATELRLEPNLRTDAIVPTAAEASAFEALQMVQVVEALAQIGAAEYMGRFLLHLGNQIDSPAEWSMATRLARDLGRPREAIRLAKLAGRAGIDLGAAGYPVWPLPDSGQGASEGAVEPALVLAVIRQESGFDPEAISRAGARGLMQLMPATALRTAKKVGIGYAKARLTADPDYNIQLGQAYLSDMLTRYDGSAALALAAYNAGPNRVDRWLRENGDPRAGEIDRLDWVESIPLTETRNYVQRVLEAMPIYEAILAGGQLAYRPVQ